MSDPTKQFWNQRYQERAMISTLDFAHKAYKYLKENSHVSILDVGCGDGRDSIYFSKQGLKVTAIDFSEEAIMRLQTGSPAVIALVKNIGKMDFPNASFDAVYAHLSLHYFDDPTTDSVFQNIRRMLKPDGLFFVRCKSIHDPFYGKGQLVAKDMFMLKHVRHFFSKEYLQEKLRDFEILSLEDTESVYDGKQSCFVEAIVRKKY